MPSLSLCRGRYWLVFWTLQKKFTVSFLLDDGSRASCRNVVGSKHTSDNGPSAVVIDHYIIAFSDSRNPTCESIKCNVTRIFAIYYAIFRK